MTKIEMTIWQIEEFKKYKIRENKRIDGLIKHCEILLQEYEGENKN